MKPTVKIFGILKTITTTLKMGTIPEWSDGIMEVLKFAVHTTDGTPVLFEKISDAKTRCKRLLVPMSNSKVFTLAKEGWAGRRRPAPGPRAGRARNPGRRRAFPGPGP